MLWMRGRSHGICAPPVRVLRPATARRTGRGRGVESDILMASAQGARKSEKNGFADIMRESDKTASPFY